MRKPVLAAVPNYNMGESLKILLPQLLKQNYDAIYVLDDASTDNSVTVAKSFGTAVTVIEGKYNVGGGANRNRISAVASQDEIIHFIDADMRLETSDVPDLAREIMIRHDVGLVGGLVKNVLNKQLPFNYGPRQSLINDLGAQLQARVYRLSLKNTLQAQKTRTRFRQFLHGYPNVFIAPEPRKVFWTSEANMLISASVFANLGGFDPKMREHEIQDLAIKMDKAGLRRLFDPRLSAIHTAVLVRPGSRRRAMLKDQLYVVKKHGIPHYFKRQK